MTQSTAASLAIEYQDGGDAAMLHVSVMGFLQRAARNELRRAAVPVAVVGSMRRGWQTLKKRRSFLTLSPAAKGQTGEP